MHFDNPIVYTNTRPEFAAGAAEVVRRAFGVSYENWLRDQETCLRDFHIMQHIKQFPEGQFVALDGKRVVSAAVTLRTSYPPTSRPLPWLDAIGGLYSTAHEPNGEWLYGQEFAVDPEYQGRGIGKAMYKKRFDLVKRLNLRGFYAGGMLMGYKRYREQMSVREYGEKVLRGEITDPTVSMQLKQGFRPVRVIENYMHEPDAGNCAMLILWENPEYVTRTVARTHHPVISVPPPRVVGQQVAVSTSR